MTELRRLFEEVTPALAPVSRAVVDADLARARRGLRRSVVLRGTRSGILLAVASAAIVLTVQNGLPVGTGPESAESGPSISQHASATALVAYTGPAPVGFTIDQIPAGWVVEGVDRGTLTLVPAGLQDRDAYRDRVADGVRALEGRIAVWRSERLPQRVGTAVRVNGTDALVVALDKAAAGDHLGGYSLFLPQAPRGYLTVQVPAELNWSTRQLAAFSAGIHMTDNAITTGG